MNNLDPRIEDLFQQIDKIKKAILILAGNLDGVLWRVSTEQERKTPLEISERIREMLEHEN